MNFCELIFHLFEYYGLITIWHWSTFIIYDYTFFIGQLYNKQHVFWKHLNNHYIFMKNILCCDNNILFNISLSFKSQSKR